MKKIKNFEFTFFDFAYAIVIKGSMNEIQMRGVNSDISFNFSLKVCECSI